MGKTILIMTALFAGSLSLSGQSLIKDQKVERDGRTVNVSFTVDSEGRKLPSRYKEVIMPFLYSGKDTVFLEPVEIYGKARYKRERQWQTLEGDRDWTLGENAAIRGASVAYSSVIPYRRWMKSASLDVKREVVGCGCTESGVSENLVGPTELYVPPVPVVAEEVEPLKANYAVKDVDRRYRFEKEEMVVFFKVSKVELRLDEFGNRETLDEIVRAVREIQGSEDMKLKKIEITGYASPEGSLTFNRQLASGRAEALKNYLKTQMPVLENDDFFITNGEENWSGLREMVFESDIDRKDEILGIIDFKKGEDRKRSLKAIDGGKTYQYMLRNLYPELRNACYIAVYYDALGDIAADEINAANALIRKGEYELALQLLDQYGDDSRSFNSIGVCLMMLQREPEAEVWFRKAMDAGNSEAEKNLEQFIY